jgi:hypothetical protein
MPGCSWERPSSSGSSSPVDILSSSIIGGSLKICSSFFEHLTLDKLEQALDVSKPEQKTTAVDPVEDILLGKLDYNKEDAFSPTRVDGIERMLRDLEGDAWGEREARMGSEVSVDLFHEDASTLTEIPVEQKDSNCFLFTFFFPRKSALV